MTSDKIYFKNLDSIRFIAALMVFLAHGLSPSYQYLPIKNSIWEKVLNLISNGGTGVSIFFVLSGFLITYLLITEHERNGSVLLKNFYIRRILRIWPLYFLVLLFSFLIYPFIKSVLGIDSPSESNFLYHLTFLSNFDVLHVEKFCFGKDVMSQNITWSVSIEEQFYLFWPLIFVFFPKKAWPYLILLVITSSIIFRIINNDDRLVLYFHTMSVLLDLGIGGLMAYSTKESKKIRTFFEDSSTFSHLGLLIFAFCLIFLNEFQLPYPYSNALNRILISFSFALIIAAQALTKKKSLLNLGNIEFARRLGKYTYGIYLIHPIAITLTDVAARVIHLPKTSFGSLFIIGLVAFILTVILSVISFKLYESWFLARKKNYAVVKTG